MFHAPLFQSEWVCRTTMPLTALVVCDGPNFGEPPGPFENLVLDDVLTAREGIDPIMIWMRALAGRISGRFDAGQDKFPMRVAGTVTVMSPGGDASDWQFLVTPTRRLIVSDVDIIVGQRYHPIQKSCHLNAY